MPLSPGKNPKVISRNIAEMLSSGRHSRAQSIAAALSAARKPRADGGAFMETRQPRSIGPKLATVPGKSAEKFHVGPIHSKVAGRTDHLPMKVPSGSYVIPADIVSAMGEGNTIAGFTHMKRIFSGAPYGQAGNPYGQSSGPYGAQLPGKADGGGVDQGVPIVAAGGEYVLAPHEVRWAGDGDQDTGHVVLDDWVKAMRARTIKTLKGLPGPKQN